MTPVFYNDLTIQTLTPTSDIIVWYARIPDIVHQALNQDTLNRLKAPASSLFHADNFSLSFLSRDEIHTLNGFKALKKQLEWMSGRYLIKQMIQDIFFKEAALEQITLSYLDQGAPFLTDYPDIPVSLSHSNDYTAAACSRNRARTFGIDIEKITKTPDIHFLKTAFTQYEIMSLENDAGKIFKQWTLKEAYLKYIKKGFNESLHNVEIIGNTIRHNRKPIDLTVFSTLIDSDYVLSLVAD